LIAPRALPIWVNCHFDQNMPSESPCISVCQMNASTGWCEGCYRSLDEIALWGQSSEAFKQSVWQQLPHRRELALRAQFQEQARPAPTP
jgi:predicted Fe-S protein YdhL (DUF1289 family)